MRSAKLLSAILAALLLLAAPAYACLATPAPDHAFEHENAQKGEDGPMAPLMGGQDETGQDADGGGLTTAEQRANENFPNENCPNEDMHYCSEGADGQGVSH